MTRKRDQTGASQFSWQHVASRHLERSVIIERHLVNQRLGVQALGSQLNLLQMIDKRRRRAHRRDDEGPAIAGWPAEPVFPVVGHRSREPARQSRCSCFRNRHRRRLSVGRQRPGDGLWQAHRPSRYLMLRPVVPQPRVHLKDGSARLGMDSASLIQRTSLGSPCGRYSQARYHP